MTDAAPLSPSNELPAAVAQVSTDVAFTSSSTTTADRSTSSRPPQPSRSAIPLPLTLIVFVLTYWTVDMITPTVPVIQRELGLSAAGAGLVVSVFFFGRLLTNVPAAFLIDRIGPRGCAIVGGGLLAGGAAIAATAPGELPLLIGRGIQGAGVALLATAGLLSVLRVWTGGGSAMTAFNVTAGIGGSIGLFLGGVITARFGWRDVFWLCAAIGVVLLVSMLIVHTVQGRRSRTGAAPPAPVAESEVIRWRPLAGGILANLLVYGNYSIWVVSVGLFAADRFGTGPRELGTLLLVVNTIHLLAAFPAGAAVRRNGSGAAMAVGFVICAAGLIAVVMAPSFIWLYPGMLLYAIGEMISNSAAGDLVLRAGGGGGRAVGTLRLTSDVGLVAGPVLVGLLADRAGTGAPFVVLAGLTLIGAAIAVTVSRWRRPRLALA